MKRVLVTGANKGIGKATVQCILEKFPDAYVFLCSRNLDRGTQALKSMLYEGPNWDSRVEVVELDVCSKESVLNVSDYLKKKFADESHPLYGIVNNAGVAAGLFDDSFSIENLRQCLDVNVYGIKNVTDGLIGLVNPTAGGRIVNVTSASGPSFVSTCNEDVQKFLIDKNTDFQALETFMNKCLDMKGGFDGYAAAGLGSGNPYGISKACANLLTLQYSVQYPELLVNACTPGFIETDLTKPYLIKSGKSANDIGMLKPKLGTASILYCLFSSSIKEENGAHSGLYFGSDGVRSPLHVYRGPGDPAYDGAQEKKWFS